jgi:LPPG:FO 2-phospho-L-lactate transferase
MRITVLAGGVGGAKFLLGLREAIGPDDSITVVSNTGDDLWLAGLRVCPDLDSVMYALGDANDTVRGWGRAGETERVAAELTAYGVGWPWFTLGDLDIGTHIARSAWLRDGIPLSEATRRLAARWDLGVTLLPMSDQPVETHVHVDLPDGPTALHFEEWWVKHRAGVPAKAFELRGLAESSPAPGVLEAIANADVVLLAPSNPVVSIGPILAVPGIREAVRATAAPVVGLSPIVGGKVVRGMADACLTTIGVDTDAAAVARHYGARTDGAGAPGVAPFAGAGVLDGWLVDASDAAAVDPLAAVGIPTAARPLLFTSVAETAAIARDALALAATVRAG